MDVKDFEYDAEHAALAKSGPHTSGEALFMWPVYTCGVQLSGAIRIKCSQSQAHEPEQHYSCQKLGTGRHGCPAGQVL